MFFFFFFFFLFQNDLSGTHDNLATEPNEIRVETGSHNNDNNNQATPHSSSIGSLAQAAANTLLETNPVHTV